jgi:Brp/Blh family beta-carotene 15,15'-monooxygenase
MLYVAGPLDPKIEWGFAGILMFVLGIPHGAGDHLVVKKWREAHGMPFSILRFMGMYLGVMVLYALLWYFLPALSFILFILISVFHFGDLEEKESGDDNFRSLLYIFMMKRCG